MMARLNGELHRKALRLFVAIVLVHWLEHIAQAIQIWVLGWDPSIAGGVLGMFFPTLVAQEGLHYAFALFMLVGLFALRPAFAGSARIWWTVALAIQFWHHIEHVLLFAQAIAHENLFGRAVPTSIAQLIIPRVELHQFYTAVVTVPILIGAYLHMNRAGRAATTCDCASGG
ncbi:MAG: hypothetical protein ACREX8_07035 [Gammaproteobacteria bacterium]